MTACVEHRVESNGQNPGDEGAEAVAHKAPLGHVAKEQVEPEKVIKAVMMGRR